MAEIAGILASAVGSQIAGKLGELATEEATLQWQFKEDVEDMAEKMKDLEALLHDADERSRRGGSDGQVGRWLTKFKSLAYDVEDVLDELDSADLIKESQSKLKQFFSGNNQLLQRMTIAHNMKNIREETDKLEKLGHTLNLVPHEAHAERSRSNGSSAAITNEGVKTEMVGRDTEKEKIISLLFKNEGIEDISIIPIVGPGGQGKTTLAESVIADKRAGVFDIQAWVHVSKEFDLPRIGRAIIKSINSSVNIDICNMHVIQENLMKELAGRRYLIVLDDLWEEDGKKLVDLQQMLQHGGSGSRIIVTTRNQRVVDKLHTGFLENQRKICTVAESDQIKLGILSRDVCWKMMKQRAVGPDDDQTGLEKIGMQIVDKCGGLPLVVNALGQVMSEIRTVKAWEDIRDTKIYLGPTDQKDTLECLMLSYYHMKLDFKMCFTYLAVFPKGYIMNSGHLIQQWKALGYIHGTKDGQRCINYLLGMSFLHISGSSLVRHLNDMASQDLSMHDLVHDLASLIIANESLVLDCTDKRKWKKTRYCRHAQLINCKNKCKVFKDLPSKIRSLHFRDSGNVQLKAKAFSQSKYIRVLDLSGCSVEGQPTPSSIVLPTSIQQLKLLRYLDVTGLPITSLPNTFHTLRNMQTLILSNCSLETLPENISRFKKLCYLDLSSNINLKKLPTSLGELSDLSFLNISGCFLLQELPESICELANLWHLDMSKCCALEKLPDKFGSLHKLIFLNLSYCCKLTKLPTNVSLESLEHMNLSSCHELENLPEVFGNLSKLCYLNLSGCYKIGMLPESFCQLEYLKDLDVSDCHNLTELPSCFGNLSELESLNLTSCPKLQRLPESFHKLIKLKHLNLSHCTSLKRLPSLFADLNLQILDISCAALEDLPDSICYMTSLTQLLVMSGHPKVVEKAKAVRKSLNFPGIVLHTVHEMDSERFSSILDLAQLTCNELSILHLENVKHPDDGKRANLRDKSELQLLGLSWDLKGHDLPEMENDAQEGKCVLESLVPPRTLENFVLDGYMSKEFPNWMSHISYYLPSLTYLSLSDLGTCENLPPFGQLPNLRSICMHNIPNIKKIGHEFYGEGGTCRKLREIKLESMENLEEWWTTTSGEESENFCIPDILKLQLKDCPKLKFLPYPPRSMRWLLDNSDEVLPEHGFGSLSSAIFPFAMKIENCNFSPAEWDRLQHLSTLVWLQVSSCRVSRGLTDVIGCFSSLRGLKLSFLKDLETLPEWLGHFKSLEVVHIHDCCKVTFLPETMKNLTTLKHLILGTCQVLNALPEWLGHLTSLETIIIAECGSLATCLPESMKNLIALKKLMLSGCKEVEILPEWLGQLLSLREIYFSRNPKVTSLPESIQNLTALMELRIRNCPRLISRCQGEDAYKISHIPTVILDNKRYMGGIGERSFGEHSFGLSCLISPSRPLNSFVLDRFAHQAS
ncbi:putative disease resistance protein RGA3 [Hordeum vulgare subsp. vulgare]|nr:putative disease resistance protein RGA3 [Hordeum vulgare subsp. vulgare]